MTTLTDGTISNNVAVDAASSWSYVQFETNVVSLPVFHVLQRKATGRDSKLPNKIRVPRALTIVVAAIWTQS